MACNDALRRIYGDPTRRWIVAVDLLPAATWLVERLAGFGARPVLAVGSPRGTGPWPDPELAPDPVLIDVPARDTVMAAIRAGLDTLADLPPDARQHIDRFDPDHTARVITPLFGDGRPVGGRTVWGARPAAWQALEDKTTVDALWTRLGLPCAPHAVVDIADPVALDTARRRLDPGLGVVLAADARDGFHGGGEGTRWVRPGRDLQGPLDELAGGADRVRVMPFLEGIPCSIHGLVLPDTTLAFRPCEMLVFRRPDASAFHYGRAATFWDPPATEREAMRTMTRRVGDALRDEVGYRGLFTIDGVMTAEGFRPTELNPRMGAATGLVTAALDDFEPHLFNLAVIEGALELTDPHAFEELVIDSADRHRRGAVTASVTRTLDDTLRAGLRFTGPGLEAQLVDPDAPELDADVMAGPGVTGGYVRVRFEPERTPVGPSLAPRAIAALQAVDARWNLGIGPLEPARDLR